MMTRKNSDVQNSSSLNSQDFRRTGNMGNLSFCKLSYQEIDVLKLVLVLQRLFLEFAGHFSPSDLPGRPKTCGIPEGRKQRGAVVLEAIRKFEMRPYGFRIASQGGGLDKSALSVL